MFSTLRSPFTTAPRKVQKGKNILASREDPEGSTTSLATSISLPRASVQARRQLLDEIGREASAEAETLRRFARRLAESPRDDRLKLFVTWRTLQFRRQQADLFYSGRYLPLTAEGARAEHVCAFAWQLASAPGRPEQLAVVVAPRLLAGLTPSPAGGELPPPPIGPEVWQDTKLVAAELAPWPLRNLFTGQECSFDHSRLALAEVLSDFPVALLTNVE
jgi:(1->4)-alpha-D-glucan 1-alpha-D-glucosylmutase